MFSKISQGISNRWVYFSVPIFSVLWYLSLYFLFNVRISLLDPSYLVMITFGLAGSLMGDHVMTNKMVKQRRFSKVLMVYTQSKILLNISIPLLVISVTLLYIKDAITSVDSNLLFLDHSLLNLSSIILVQIVVNCLSIIMRVKLSKDLTFYFSREYIKEATKSVDEADKMDYLIKALKAYNRYIQKKLSGRFDEYSVFSKVIAAKFMEKGNSIDSFMNSFTHSNKMMPLMSMSKFIDDGQNILVSERLLDKIKGWSLFIIPVVA